MVALMIGTIIGRTIPSGITIAITGFWGHLRYTTISAVLLIIFPFTGQQRAEFGLTRRVILRRTIRVSRSSDRTIGLKIV